jgi:hypothetical protein
MSLDQRSLAVFLLMGSVVIVDRLLLHRCGQSLEKKMVLNFNGVRLSFLSIIFFLFSKLSRRVTGRCSCA